MKLKTIQEPIHTEIEVKKSKFIAYLFPIQSEEEAKQYIQQLKKEHFKARHHCSAYRLDGDFIIEHSSDDGEPSGTAGRPMLDVLRYQEVTNVLAVVVRYFGGIKLGTGGLARAYGDAVRTAFEQAILVEKVEQQHFTVTLPYDQYDRLIYFLDQHHYHYENVQYSDVITLDIYSDLSVAQEVVHTIESTFHQLTLKKGQQREIYRPL